MKRFNKEFKESQREVINDLFVRVINRRRNGKDYTIHMVVNWIYDRNKNEELDREMAALLTERGVIIPDDAYEAEEVMA